MDYLRSFRLVSGVTLLGLLLSCGGGDDSGATLRSIEVTPNIASAAAGTQSQMTATGIYGDGSHRDLTYDAAWSSSNSAVANVNAGGVASAVSPGTATISASVQGVAGSGSLNVTAATLTSIEVTPSLTAVAKGTSLQFVATGIFSDKSTQNLTAQVDWSTSNANIASISGTTGSNGLATATSLGSVTIAAASGGVSGNTTLTVTGATLASIQITPPMPNIPKGANQPFVAMGIFSDNSTQVLTTQVTWSSSAPGIATVSNSAPNNGVVTAVAVGTATLTATTDSLSATVQVTVTPATLVSIQVNPPIPSIASGLNQQFTATGIYTDNSTQNLTSTVTWATSAASVATVSNAAGSHGLASSTSPGTATVSASFGGFSGSATLTVTPAVLISIAVTPANPTVAKGLTLQLTATGTYTDGTTQNLTAAVMWSPANTAVVTVSNASGSKGLTTTASIGSTVVTATLGAVTGSTTVTVGAATLVSIQVTANSYSVAGQRQMQQFAARGTYTDASTQVLTTQVLWGPTMSSVATVSNAPGSQGLVTSVATGGPIAITATYTTATGGTVTGSANFTVTPAILRTITVTSPSTTLFNPQAPVQLSAMGTYNDGTSADLTISATWTSSDMSVATVAPNQGIVTVAGNGPVTITAAIGNISGSIDLVVTPVTISSIAVTFGTPSDGPSHTVVQSATATATYNNHHTADVTAMATWSSNATGIATVVPTGDPNATPPTVGGTITWTGIGNASITATIGTVHGSSTLTVSAPSSVAVTPTSASITGIGGTQQFVATGSYASGSLDVTRLATWTSSDLSIASIDSSGVATSVGNTLTFDTNNNPVATDSATITAMAGSIVASNIPTLIVHESYDHGTSGSIYSLFSSVTGAANTSAPAGLTCSSCHGRPISGTGATAATPAFYDSTSAATTYSNLAGGSPPPPFDYLTLGSGGIYDEACVNTPSNMPKYEGTAICAALYNWISQGASNN